MAAAVWVLTVVFLGFSLLYLLLRSRAFRQELLPATSLPPSPIRGSDALTAFGIVLIGIGSIELCRSALDTYLGGSAWREEPFRRLLLGISPTGFGALTVLALAALRSPSATRTLGLASTRPARDMVRGVTMYLAAYPGVMATTLLWRGLLARLNVEAKPQEVVDILLGKQAWPEMAASVAIAVFIAPLFEEMMFRGFLLRALSRRLGATGAVLVTAALFGLLHKNAYAAGPVFALGLLLGWLYWRTGRLWLAIGCHGANNAVALVANWLSQGLVGT